MPRVRELVGTRPCLACEVTIPVKRSGGEGAVSASCPYCDLSAYGRPGTQAFKIITDPARGFVVSKQDEKPEPEPAAVPAAVPAARRRSLNPFDLTS